MCTALARRLASAAIWYTQAQEQALERRCVFSSTTASAQRCSYGKGTSLEIACVLDISLGFYASKDEGETEKLHGTGERAATSRTIVFARHENAYQCYSHIGTIVQPRATLMTVQVRASLLQTQVTQSVQEPPCSQRHYVV